MSDELFCNLNGRILAVADTPFSSADDHFRLRYGLYETYLYKEGSPEYASLHWERLKYGLSVLGFNMPDHFSEQFFSQQIDTLVFRNKHRDLSRVRLQVFTDDTSGPYTPQFLVESFPLEEKMTGWLEQGIRVAVLPDFQKEISPASNCKISHNQHFLPARKMMEEAQLDDVLLRNTKDRIAESSMANLFWVKNGIVYTTPLSEGCLAGTIRTVIIECLRKNKIPFEEQACMPDDLQHADELFLSNGIRKIRWVREMDGKHYRQETTRAIYRLLCKA